MRLPLSSLTRLTALFIPLLILCGCEGPYSALDPAGPSAEIAAWLWWGMFAFFMLVLMVVVGLWVYAMYRDPGADTKDQVHASKIVNRWVVGGGIILPTVTITVILIFGIPAGERMLTLPQAQQEPLRIDVTGRQFQWDIYYPDTGIALTDEVHIPVGVPVDFHLTTADVIHSFWVPRLGRKLDTIPGRINILRLVADEPGVYGGLCAEYCGLDHAHMQFVLIAHDPDDFTLWLQEMSDGR